jgi:hypothetical protein
VVVTAYDVHLNLPSAWVHENSLIDLELCNGKEAILSALMGANRPDHVWFDPPFEHQGF